VGYGVILGVIAVLVALFMLVSVSISHGVYAVIVLPLCAVALALWGGPERLARRVTVDSEGLRIERFHSVRTVIEWGELTDAHAQMMTNRRHRTRAELVLVPADPAVFFSRHRELRAVRDGDRAIVPVGWHVVLVRDAAGVASSRAAETASELNAALSALQPRKRHPEQGS
jgi:hypothetical protein